eukprot:scaffold42457_cov68-Phaeocystis_antarctica.AAC.3
MVGAVPDAVGERLGITHLLLLCNRTYYVPDAVGALVGLGLGAQLKLAAAAQAEDQAGGAVCLQVAMPREANPLTQHTRRPADLARGACPVEARVAVERELPSRRGGVRPAEPPPAAGQLATHRRQRSQPPRQVVRAKQGQPAAEVGERVAVGIALKVLALCRASFVQWQLEAPEALLAVHIVRRRRDGRAGSGSAGGRGLGGEAGRGHQQRACFGSGAEGAHDFEAGYHVPRGRRLQRAVVVAATSSATSARVSKPDGSYPRGPVRSRRATSAP